MVDVVIKKKPQRSRKKKRDRPSVGEVAWGVPGAARGLQEIIESKPARWLGNVFKKTGQRGAKYFGHKPNEGIIDYAKRTFSPSNFFRNPLKNEYDKDMVRYPLNQLAMGTELTHDLIQYPFEALGQGLGWDVGSGKGYGDLGTMIATTPSLFGENPPTGIENAIRNLVGAQYRPDEVSALEDMIDESTMNLAPNWQTDPEGFITDPSFKNYLQNVRGYNIGDDFTADSFAEKFIEPRSDEIQTFEEFENTYVPDNDYIVKDDDYWNMVFNAFQDDVVIPHQTKIMKELTTPFYDYQFKNTASDLAERAGISEDYATYILSKGQAGGLDYGLFTDMVDLWKPLDYQTAEGEEFFEDPIMDIAGFYGGIKPARAAMKSILNRNALMRKGLGQFYPQTAGLKTPIFGMNKAHPFIKGATIKGLQIPPSVRGAAQFGLLPELSNDRESLRVMERR